MRSGLSGGNQRQFHRKTESRIFEGELAPKRRPISSSRTGLIGIRTARLARLSDAAPNLAIHFFPRPFREGVGVRDIWDNREHCRTGPRHQSRADFRLIQQPCFQVREKNKFLEDRSLQIVYETLAVEILRM